MKLTRNWLKEYLDTSASLEQICATLTAIGLEVESVVDQAKQLAPFIIARIEEAGPHPNADRLKLCRVTDGSKTYQVVCGAPNARSNLTIVLARPGDVIPRDGTALKPGSIRGYESQAMCCSADELNLQAARADGIIELPDHAPIGQPYAAWAGLDDAIIELKLTPNRPDCAGIYGIARDLAAAGLGTLKPLTIPAWPGKNPSPISVSTTTPDCPHFMGCTISGLQNGESPAWLQQKLLALGLRPISALVDITNYFTFAYMRPLHVFDAAKIQGNLTVHTAQGGEVLAALNDKSYTLQPGMVAISDASGVVSLGGIMGGSSTGVTATTTSVFLEAAYFSPTRTAATGRALGITSDARWRFERGIDPAFTADGLALAVAMITELCGTPATSVSEIVAVGTAPLKHTSYPLPATKVAQLTGVSVPPARQAEILQKLGFNLTTSADASADGWQVTPPSWRPDIAGTADLVEEIIRIHGFDHIPTHSLPRTAAVTAPALSLLQRRNILARHSLAQAGLHEVISWSFMASAQATLFGWDAEQQANMRLQNPIAAELDVLRPSLLPNLLGMAARNAARGIADVALFELGPRFTGGTPGAQQQVAGLLLTGNTPRHWATPARAVDSYDIKAAVLATLSALGVNVSNLQLVTTNLPAHFHPGRAAWLCLGPTQLAIFGELHPRVRAGFDLDTVAVGAEIFLENIPTPKAKGSSTARPLLELPSLQAVARDFAFVVDAATPAATLLKAIKSADTPLLVSAEVFDVYVGERLGAGKKSLAVSVTLQPKTASLTEAELQTISDKIIAAATKAGATIRS